MPLRLVSAARQRLLAVRSAGRRPRRWRLSRRHLSARACAHDHPRWLRPRRARVGHASTAGIGSTSTMPGHGLTMRASSGKSLRKRVALELGGQVQVAQVGMAVEADAEHLVAFALVPVRTGERSPIQESTTDTSSSGTSVLMVTPTWRSRSVRRANTWNRVSPPVTPCVIVDVASDPARRSDRPRPCRTATASSRWPRGTRRT